MKKENTTIRLFEKYADKYNEMQPRLVPHYNEIISVVADAYKHYVGRGNFIDLGCGTGNVSLSILKGAPNSKVFLVDGSPAMLDIASNKIRKSLGKGRLLGGKAVNLEEKDWYDGIDEKFSVVVTAFALEHLKERDYKRVIKKCRELLEPGGVLISVEWSDDEYGMKNWFWSKMREQGRPYKQYRHIIKESIRSEKHYFVNIHKKLDWIRKAGYKNVHTIGQYLYGYIVVSEK